MEATILDRLVIKIGTLIGSNERLARAPGLRRDASYPECYTPSRTNKEQYDNLSFYFIEISDCLDKTRKVVGDGEPILVFPLSLAPVLSLISPT
jgi:hypothetical protein